MRNVCSAKCTNLRFSQNTFVITNKEVYRESLMKWIIVMLIYTYVGCCSLHVGASILRCGRIINCSAHNHNTCLAILYVS